MRGVAIDTADRVPAWLIRSAEDEARYELLRWLAQSHERAYGETGHGARVAALSDEISAAIGLPPTARRCLAAAAALHDIGKVAIDPTLLSKHDPLTSDEVGAIRLHTTIGARILSGARRGSVLHVAERIALTHHERWDGSGYHGLTGEQIPLGSRIVAVADVYDALTEPRAYKAAWSMHEAMSEISSGSGTRFDPRVVAGLETVVAVPMTVTA